MGALMTVTNNRDWLMQSLFDHEIKSLIAHFDGSGDSGEINQIAVTPVDDETEIDENELAQIVLYGGAPAGEDNTMEWVNGHYVKRDFDKRPMTLRELALLVCYEELENAHGGWEINAGSFGKIIVNTPIGGKETPAFSAIAIDYNEYEEDYSEYDEEEYNDE
jgi:hypothetical protein